MGLPWVQGEIPPSAAGVSAGTAFEGVEASLDRRPLEASVGGTQGAWPGLAHRLE